MPCIGDVTQVSRATASLHRGHFSIHAGSFRHNTYNIKFHYLVHTTGVCEFH